MIEGSRTACLLVSPAPVWRSPPAGVTTHMVGADRLSGFASRQIEAKLWAAADALRNNMDAAEYKRGDGPSQAVVTA
jgi:hypothetical protein